jgi:hypothetical protein
VIRPDIPAGAASHFPVAPFHASKLAGGRTCYIRTRIARHGPERIEPRPAGPDLFDPEPFTSAGTLEDRFDDPQLTQTVFKGRVLDRGGAIGYRAVETPE